jgi:serine/threonine protein kinase
MTDDHNPLSSLDRQRLLAVLAERDAGQPATPLSDADEATLVNLQAELATLADDLRQPPPECDFEGESDCQRAVELVESMGRPTDASSSDTALARAGAASIERLGPYEVTAKLGEGGMGAVYKATHPKLKRTVAIKVLPARRLRDAAAVARFEREMEAVGSLNHPNIVTAHDAGEDAGMHYLVMEYVDGVDLATLVRRVGPLAPAEACEIVRQAALGLAAAQSRGIVHRDVKPSNLMLAAGAIDGAAPCVKVLDFGLARLSPLRAEENELTTSGLIMGTLKYMAPEQCSRTHAVDARADVYSLGATLYKLLCGSSPYSDERFASPLALLAALGNEAPPALASRRSDVPPQLAAVVHRMLARRPEDRFASAVDVAEALAAWSREADLGALLTRAASAEADAEDPERLPSVPDRAVAIPASPLTRAGRRPRWPTLVLVGLVFVGASAVTVLNLGPPAEFASEARSRGVAQWLVPRAAEIEITTRHGFVTLQPGEKLPDDFLQLITTNLDENKDLSDDDLARFDKLPLFTSLSIGRTKIGDDGLRQLGQLPLLQMLFLSETFISDDGLKQLQRYPKLEVLHLYGTQVTDAGLVHLAGHVLLYDLSLGGCGITDEGLKQLTGLKRLRILELHRTGVTPRGIAMLQQSLPDCEFRSDYSEEEITEALQSLPEIFTQPEDR